MTRRSAAERDAVADAMATLVRADGRISVFEYCLSRLVGDELRESSSPTTRPGTGRRTLRDARQSVLTLFGILARVGHSDPEAARRAFAAGVAHTLPGTEARFTVPAGGVLELESVWPELDGLRPAEKSRLVAGAVVVISEDGLTTVPEVELLRTICLILHSPLPPLPVPG
ncbi:hypothetical protein O7632_15305 [Solwaraspora sp. WMMD406]|uniref:hypothetical protein n=1 Tax=Solwaraspora sp. WMMD406 TaxID=3016095 RepID=UPI002415F714|nr:hypothetical protein [Solwaraspora sp. WMMD406]MDG4765453.1 hypothetical protein [Solwaraspora sp. WMMD406]